MQVIRTEDSRPLLEQLRRIELWRLADKYQLPYPTGATKDDMVARFREAIERGLDLKKPPPAPRMENVSADDGLDAMGIIELRRLAKVKGVKMQRTDKIPDLIAKIRAA